MPPNLDARVKALEAKTSEISVDIKALTNDVSEIKGKIAEMPTTFQLQTWFVGIALGLATVVVMIA